MSVGRLVDDGFNASIVLAGRLLVGFGRWRSNRRPPVLPLGAEALTKAEEAEEVLEPWAVRTVSDEELDHVFQERRDAAAETGGLDICVPHNWAGWDQCPTCLLEPGPGVVTTPTPGQPTIQPHVLAVLQAHKRIDEMFGMGAFCEADGCGWRGAGSQHDVHLSELIGELVAAETRIAHKLRAAGEK